MNVKSILVLDDDRSFRELLVRILSPTGFAIIEARSAKDALALIAKAELVLAIVDFRMPETDGMTFISRLREAGHDTPVVFVSGTWCDPSTFNRLRNILRVSLILQKPIQPQLFLQQIDILLPLERPKLLTDNAETSYDALLQAAAGMESELNAQDEQRLSDIEKCIRDAQKELSVNVPPEWEKLSKSIKQLQQNLQSASIRAEASALAHTLKGTAGSLGLMKASEAAGKIENYTKMLDADDPLGQEILWLEIFRALADGESELRQIVSAETTAPAETVQAGRVLLLSTEQRVHQYAHQLTPAVEAQFTYTDIPVEAARKAAATRFDAAILDLSRFTKSTTFSLSRALRMTDMNDGLPIAFVTDADESISDTERLFYGASAMLKAPVDQTNFEEMLCKLASVNQSQQVRVLAVDDDPVLTTFIERVLSSHGMAVSTLNEPINILDALDKSQPNLILLDVIMPGLSGYDICRMLRVSEKWNKIPIIFLTSKSDAQGRSAAFQAGASDFLSKPIISEELLLRVKLQLQQAKAEKESHGTDETTGLLTEAAVKSRAGRSLLETERNGQQLSLCLLEIEDLAQFDAFGVFSSINVLATLGRLLQSRFPAESIRGRWTSSGFALIFPGEELRTVDGAAVLFADEFEQISFTGEGGTTFSARIRFASASAPADGKSVAALYKAAEDRLLSATPG